jgi:glyoxalase family protein
MSEIHGIHHVTAIAADPQQNLDFYTQSLGMRLVKKSVNQDVPDTYHLFYADAAGHPGCDLTFFPWPDLGPRRRGHGLSIEVSFAVPTGSLTYWSDRLKHLGQRAGTIETRFGEATLPLSDPHGFELTLVETADAREFSVWDRSPVPAEHQIRGIHAVRLLERELSPTVEFLQKVMGFSALGEERGWHRLGADGGGSGNLVEVHAAPDERRGAWGVGGVHHVAWRVRDDQAQRAARAAVAAAGRRPTEVIDRFWFKSVYFLEPGGVLFELATDGPGFTADEDADALGERLVLPPWLEPRRRQIEAALPPLRSTAATQSG